MTGLIDYAVTLFLLWLAVIAAVAGFVFAFWWVADRLGWLTILDVEADTDWDAELVRLTGGEQR